MEKKKIKAPEKEYKHVVQVVKELPLIPQRQIIDDENDIIYDLVTTEEALTDLLSE